MPERRDIITIAAMIIADTAWLYPIFIILGISLNHGAPLLPLTTIMLVMVLGLCAGQLVTSYLQDPARRGPTLAVIGLAVIYLVLAALAAEQGFDLLWGLHLVTGEFSGLLASRLILGTAAVGFLWHRGIRISTESHLSLRLLKTFRSGIVMLALCILVEQAFNIDASVNVMLVLFFTACLAGLAFAHLPTGAGGVPIITLAVSAVLGGGFIIGMMATVIGGSGLRIFAAAWSYLGAAIMWLLYQLARIVRNLLPAPGSSAREQRDRSLGEYEFSNPMNLDFVPPDLSLLGHLIEYALLGFAVYLLYRLLRWAYQTHGQRLRSAGPDERSSIRGEADATADLMNLFLGLLPTWLRSQNPPPALRVPHGNPGIAEAFALYFDMLTAAHAQGHHFVPSATPSERLLAVAEALPGAPVARITGCFNAACYGNLATDAATLNNLRRELEGTAGVQ